MADEQPNPPDENPDSAWLARMRKRQQESYLRLTEQQSKAEQRFNEISDEIFADIMGTGEKKEPPQQPDQ